MRVQHEKKGNLACLYIDTCINNNMRSAFPQRERKIKRTCSERAKTAAAHCEMAGAFLSRRNNSHTRVTKYKYILVYTREKKMRHAAAPTKGQSASMSKQFAGLLLLLLIIFWYRHQMIIISAARRCRRRRTPPPATLANLFGRAGGFARDVTLLPRRSMPHAARMIGLEIKDDRKVISSRSISPGGRATRSPRVSRCAHDLFISIQAPTPAWLL
jgi:hypothetical protein